MATNEADRGHPASPAPAGEAVTLLESLMTTLPEKSVDRARALQMLGESKGGPEGIAIENEALALFREVGATPLEVAEAQNSLAVLHFRDRRTGDAYALWKEVLPVLERDLGPDHPDTLRVLNNLSVSSPDQRTSGPLSNDWNNLGAALAIMREYKGAEEVRGGFAPRGSSGRTRGGPEPD